MISEIVEYDGFLTFGPLTPERLLQVQTAACETLPALEIDVQPTSMEYRYTGRDTQQKNVRFLAQIAPLIGDAEGEVVCSYRKNDGQNSGDLIFQFYTIRGGRLYYQLGLINREQKAEVVLDTPTPERRPQLITA